MSEISAFDGRVGEQFLDHYGTVRGNIRQEVTRNNLLEHLPDDTQLNVLDFGGGNASDAIWLAKMGHRVTLIDISEDMVLKGRAAALKEGPAVQDLIVIEKGNEDSIAQLHRQFDLVLSHAVLMYEIENPVRQLRQLNAVLNEGGLISILTKGLKAARNQADPAELPELNRKGRFTNRRGIPSVAYSFDQLEFMVKRIGLTTEGKYGIRVLFDNDHRSLNEIPKDELDRIITTETRIGREPEYRDQAQMLQIIARKAKKLPWVS